MSPILVDDGPYRSTSVEQRLVSAPRLVKLTAFCCFFVGQWFALVAIVPALFLGRSGVMLAQGVTVAHTTDIALMVYRLGSLLLQREAHAVFSLDLSMRLLRLRGRCSRSIGSGFTRRGRAARWWSCSARRATCDSTRICTSCFSMASRCEATFEGKLCVRYGDFTLHARTRAGAMNEKGREALLRYILRPPMPRLRPRVVPKAKPREHEAATDETCEEERPKGSRYWRWGELLKRTFDIELLCPTCQEPLKLVALVRDDLA